MSLYEYLGIGFGIISAIIIHWLWKLYKIHNLKKGYDRLISYVDQVGINNIDPDMEFNFISPLINLYRHWL